MIGWLRRLFRRPRPPYRIANGSCEGVALADGIAQGEREALMRLRPAEGESWEEFAAEREQMLARMLHNETKVPVDGNPQFRIVGDYWYDWDNPGDRPAMREALGRFAPDGPVFGGDR